LFFFVFSFFFSFQKQTGGPYKQLTMTGMVVFLGYLAHLVVHQKYDEAPRMLEVEEIAKWRKQNPTIEDFKMLDKLKHLREQHHKH
jgi:hypothetical protein